MPQAKGFCDLNIIASGSFLKQTVLKALRLGYQTVAINTEVTDTLGDDKKKRKKGENTASLVPPPPKLELTEQDLKFHKITKKPVILTRITVAYSNPGSPFLSKYKEALQRYDIIAFSPTTEAAFRQIVTQTLVNVDIISPNLSETKTRLPGKILALGAKQGIYYEIYYAPTLNSGHSRQQTISMAHVLNQNARSITVIITSRASQHFHLRGPYDVMNLGRFFGMTEGAAMSSVASAAHDAVYCAAARKLGAAKCAAALTVLGGDGNTAKKFKGLDDAESFAKSDLQMIDG